MKQRALEAQLSNEATINYNILTFNHTPQDLNHRSWVYRDTPFPQRMQSKQLQEGGVFGQSGCRASDDGV